MAKKGGWARLQPNNNLILGESNDEPTTHNEGMLFLLLKFTNELTLVFRSIELITTLSTDTIVRSSQTTLYIETSPSPH